MIRMAHILKPVQAGPESDLFRAQPVTFETMRRARIQAGSAAEISFLSAQFPEDRDWVPDDFERTPDLENSIQFVPSRKLPLIRDILGRLDRASDADYFIYTNADIALVPEFYCEVVNLIRSGYDAFVINRRTIPDTFDGVRDIPKMLLEKGEPHPGYDCFVFSSKHYRHYRLGEACVGTKWIGRLLVLNLMIHAERFEIFREAHLTFHLGDRKEWKNPEYAPYRRHNENEMFKVLSSYEADGYLEKSRVLSEAWKPLFIKYVREKELPHPGLEFERWIESETAMLA